MCSSGQPTPPDTKAIVDTATKANQQTAQFQAGLNNVNQVTPYGNLTYTSTPGKNGAPPQYTATSTLSPGLQSVIDALQKGQGSIASAGASQAAGLGKSLTPISQPTYASYGGAPSLMTSGGQIGGLTSSVKAGPIDSTIANAGKVNGVVQGAGAVDGTVSSAGNITKNIAGAGPIQTSLGDGYTDNRQKYEDTLFGQLDQQSGKDRATLESSLANKGIALGSDAYTRAMNDFDKGLSANRTNAILQAGSLQGQDQTLALNSGNFANSAQQQQYGQNANDATFHNTAQGQQYGQNANDVAVANAAQAQRYGQNANNTTIGLQAQAQQYGQNSNDVAVRNAAQAQQFTQGQQNAALGNSAQGQLYSQTANDAAARNAALQQMFSNQTQLTGLNNQNQTQAFQDAISGNNQRINQSLSLLNGTPVQTPSFVSTPQTGVGGVDTAGIAQQGYANANNQYQQQQQNLGGIFGTVGTLASSVLPFILSDARTKTDIAYTGERTADDIPLAEFRYRGEPAGIVRRGVIAQDVMQRRPDAVARIGGIFAVNANKIPEAAGVF